MMWSRRRWCMAGAVGGLAVAAGFAGGGGGQAGGGGAPPRQVGIGMQGQFGTLLDGAKLGSEFAAGPGLTVRLRYRMRYERAIGFSFESQTFDARNPQPPDSLFAPERLTFITSGVEFYKLYGTRTRTTRMLSLGLGLAQVSERLRDGETFYPNDGLYLSAGAGVERFFWNSWAWDLSARYMTVFQNGETNHDLQASLGLIFYASY